LIALFASAAGAQQLGETRTVLDYEANSSKGIRVALVSPFLKMNVKASAGGFSASDSMSIDRTLGASIGYASLPIQRLGLTTAVMFASLKEEDGSAKMWRLNGNLAYATNENLSIFGGLNLSNLDF